MVNPPRPPGAGKSSFDLIDPKKAFHPLHLRKGNVLLDVGSGAGAYSLFASALVGEKGIIYAVDAWEEGMGRLREQVLARGIKNIRPIVTDASRGIPIADASIDRALVATVLHDLVVAGTSAGVLREIRRALRPQGMLAVIEFKKIEGPPGPPATIRLSPDQVEAVVAPYGFRKETTAEVGPYNYLITFTLMMDREGVSSPSKGKD